MPARIQAEHAFIQSAQVQSQSLAICGRGAEERSTAASRVTPPVGRLRDRRCRGARRMSGPISCTVQACRMALSALILVCYSSSSLAAGEPVAKGKAPPQTVTWYADHQRERARVQLAASMIQAGSAPPGLYQCSCRKRDLAARQAKLHDGE